MLKISRPSVQNVNFLESGSRIVLSRANKWTVFIGPERVYRQHYRMQYFIETLTLHAIAFRGIIK